MGFSEQTKEELLRVVPSARCCRLAEITAFYDFYGYLLGQKRQYMDFYSFSPLAARKILILIKHLFPGVYTQTLVQRPRARKNQFYTVRLPVPDQSQSLYDAMQNQPLIPESRGVLRKKCCQRSYLRGAFICQGSITNPERTYHAEIASDQTLIAEKVFATVRALGLEARLTQRKAVHVIYLKDGGQIVELLNLIGAHSALLKLETIRVLKDVRNNVNRIVNCETANVDKTVKAAVEQLKLIVKIEEQQGLSQLPEKLQQVALARLEHPYMSLKELGQQLTPPLSKSGISYRMQQLVDRGKALLDRN